MIKGPGRTINDVLITGLHIIYINSPPSSLSRVRRSGSRTSGPRSDDWSSWRRWAAARSSAAPARCAASRWTWARAAWRTGRPASRTSPPPTASSSSATAGRRSIRTTGRSFPATIRAAVRAARACPSDKVVSWRTFFYHVRLNLHTDKRLWLTFKRTGRSTTLKIVFPLICLFIFKSRHKINCSRTALDKFGSWTNIIKRFLNLFRKFYSPKCCFLLVGW